ARPVLGDRIWEIASPEMVSLNELIDITCARLGGRKRKMHIPLALSLLIARSAEALLGRKSPITRDMILGMNESVRFDSEPTRRDLNLKTRGIREVIENLRGSAPWM